MKTTPVMTVTGKSEVARKFCSATTRPAPKIGPMMVPMPPSRVISTTSPDICQVTSVSVANWKTRALMPPARPASAADMTKAPSL